MGTRDLTGKHVGVVIALALGALACETKQAAEPPPASAAAATATATPPQPAPEPSGLVFGDGDPPDGATVVVIAERSILLGDESEPVVTLPDRETLVKEGLAARSARDGEPASLLIAPLAERLRAAPSSGEAEARSVVVVAHGQTPYRLLTEVLFTLGQSEIARHHLAVMKEVPSVPAAVVAVETPPVVADAKPLAGVADGPLDLVARLEGRGVSLRVRGGSIAPGCDGLGSGVTIPPRGDALDLPALAACAARLKKLRPSEAAVTIVADPGARFDEVIAVIEALRVAKEGPMFSNLQFGIPR